MIVLGNCIPRGNTWLAANGVQKCLRAYKVVPSASWSLACLVVQVAPMLWALTVGPQDGDTVLEDRKMSSVFCVIAEGSSP